jgi:mRNA interferase RelE/StbE
VASYRVEIKKSAVKELETLGGKKDRERIVERILSLATEPRPVGVEKLTDKEQYRLRQGNYRILYEIRDDLLLVVVIKVGDRKEVYRR